MSPSYDQDAHLAGGLDLSKNGAQPGRSEVLAAGDQPAEPLTNDVEAKGPVARLGPLLITLSFVNLCLGFMLGFVVLMALAPGLLFMLGAGLIFALAMATLLDKVAP